MDFYLLSLLLVSLAALLYLLLKRMTSHSTDSSLFAAVANEKAGTLDRQYVPGDSPAYYTGETSNDVLVINALDLTPNPPRE